MMKRPYQSYSIFYQFFYLILGLFPLYFATAAIALSESQAILAAASQPLEIDSDSTALLVSAATDSLPGTLQPADSQNQVEPTQIDTAPLFFAEAASSSPQSTEATPSANAPANRTTLIAQLTSVSQLSDVEPSDWAFQALQTLVERYGCIVGYPDRTFRGSRALTRYEFAAGLNSCLDRIRELIAQSTEDLATKEDLATLQRLQEEFAAELATLRGRVDSLEARTAELEANQFSTTTKLSGELVFTVAGATGAYPGSNTTNATPAILNNFSGVAGSDTQIAANYRLRLNLSTSFSGKDLLIMGLQAYNYPADPNSLQGTLGYSDPSPVELNASQVRLGTEPQFPGSNASTLSNIDPNSVQLYKLLYIFPVADTLTLFAGTNAETTDAFPAIAPFASDSQGALSRFAGHNAAVRVSGGTSGTGLASALGFIWTPTSWLDFRALYASVNAALSSNQPLDAGTLEGRRTTPLGAGLFGGSSVVAAQLTVRPTSTLDIGLNYANSYHQINILGTGLASSDIGSILFNPSGRCNTNGFTAAAGEFGCARAGGGGVDGNATVVSIASEPIRLNSIGSTATWRFAPKLSLTASGAVIFADLVNVNASTTFSSWLVGLHTQDFLGKGNSSALIFGKPLSRVAVGGDALALFEDATPLHLEGYINFRINDNISITPGAFAVFNPEGYSGNDTALVGVIRTTFRF